MGTDLRHGLFNLAEGERGRRLRLARVVAAFLVAGIVLSRVSSGAAAQGNRQWSEPIDITQPSDSNMKVWPVVLCDQYQNVHLLWSELSDRGAAIFYRTDVDGSWGSPVDVLAPVEPVAVSLDAAISNLDDTLHVVWQNANAGGGLLYSSTPLRDAGSSRAWSPPRMLAQITGAGSLATDAAGVIHLVYGAVGAEGVDPTVYYLTSRDSGESWGDPVAVFSTVEHLPSEVWAEIALGDAGRIYVGVTWRSQEYGAQSEIGYVVSSDGGQTWSAYHRVDATGVTYQGVARIVPFAFGREVHLTWHDPRRMHKWSSDSGITWSPPTEIMPLGAAFGGPNYLVRDSGGIIHAVMAVGDGVFSADWVDGKWGAPERIDSRFIDPHAQHMAVCQGNRLHVVYYDRTGDNTVWYSSRELAAPHIDRRPFPVATPRPLRTPTTPSAEREDTVEPTLRVTRTEATEAISAKAASGTVPAILVSVVSASALVAIVVTRWHLASRRHTADRS